MAQLRDLRFRRLAGGEHFIAIEVVSAHGSQRQIGVFSRPGVALQLLPAPSEAYDLPRQSHVLPSQIDDVARIEKKRTLPRQCRPTLSPVLPPEIAALQRMHLLESDAAPIPTQQE